MSTVKDIVLRASTTLRDQEPGHEFTTWSKTQLVDYLQEGICELAGLRPDLFTKTQKLALKPGAVQTLPEGVSAILDVAGNVTTGVDGTETVTETIKVANRDLLRRFGKKACLDGSAAEATCDPAKYVVNSFVRSEYSMNEFRVDPPVPQGGVAEITATVVVEPQSITVADYDAATPLSCAHHAQLLDWVLHRAYEQETESAYAINAKQWHFNKFYHGVGIDYFAASRANSGYNLGLEGHGDVRSGPPRELRSMRFGG